MNLSEILHPTEDSPDLTDSEVQQARPTADPREVARLILASLGEGSEGYSILKQEVRRRGPHLYLRVTVGALGKPHKALVYQTDWMGAHE